MAGLARLNLAQDLGATFVDSVGASNYFVLQPDGSYATAANVYAGLSKQTDTGGVVTYKLTDSRARIAWIFDATGRLVSTTDRNGETTGFTWGTNKITVTLPTENAGRTLTLSFNGDPNSTGSHVTSVVDPRGTGPASTPTQLTVTSPPPLNSMESSRRSLTTPHTEC
jgi:hypothetical protein